MASANHSLSGVDFDRRQSPDTNDLLLHGTQLRRETVTGLTAGLYELPSTGTLGGVVEIRTSAYRDLAEQHHEFPDSDGPGEPIGFHDHAVGLWFPPRDGSAPSPEEAWEDLTTLAKTNREFEEWACEEVPEIEIDEDYPVFAQSAALQGDRLFTVEEERYRASVFAHPRRDAWFALLDKRTGRFADHKSVQKTVETPFCDYTDSIGRWTEVRYLSNEEALIREHLRQLMYVAENSRQTIDSLDKRRDDREPTEAEYAHP